MKHSQVAPVFSVKVSLDQLTNSQDPYASEPGQVYRAVMGTVLDAGATIAYSF